MLPDAFLTDHAAAPSPGRRAQLEQLFDMLLRRPDCSRFQLADELGLSRSTLISLLTDAEQAGLLTQRVWPGDGRRVVTGRPPYRISVVPEAAFAIGLDLGSSHIRSTVCDVRGRVVALRSARVAPDCHPQDSLDIACSLTGAALREARVPSARVLGAGVGLTVPVDSRTGETPSPGLASAWHHVQPAAELRERLQLPVWLVNDANAGALGERAFGAAREASTALFLLLSTSVNVGLILQGKLHTGATGSAGELGHTRVVEPGVFCRCGNRGCLETVASSTAVVEEFSRFRREPTSLTELLELARSGNRGARRVLAEAGEAAGRAIAVAVNLLTPELIIVGGDLAPAGATLFRPIRAEVERASVASTAAIPRVVASELGENAVALGAATVPLERAPAMLAARLA